MSLSSILLQINKKGQVQKQATESRASSISNGQQTQRNNGPSINVLSQLKQVDPVVAMLKEKRRLEKEKKEQELREKKGLPPAKSKPGAKSSKTSGLKMASKTVENPRNPRTVPPRNSPPITNPPPRAVLKKLNFNELIKKASKIDNSKLSISIKPKTKSPEAPTNNTQKIQTTTNTLRKPMQQPNSFRVPQNGSLTKSARTVQPVKPIPEKPIKNRAPIPVRKPSAQLEAKLKKGSAPRKEKGTRYSNSYDDEEEEDSSFIVSDDEFIENDPVDYDRDEIWAMFNKGKKRSYFDRYDDYDSDDMEATGNEIFEEEMRSKRRAELEDKKEQEMERKLQEEKKARKLKRT